jgi:S-adenosyl-L-methionine hydrolase (adenosine-forming)
MKQLITVTTDFGDNFAASQLRAVVYALGFDGNYIENHDVSHFSVIEGAFQMMTLARFCAPSTVHVGVVDPGVGSSRTGIIIQSKNFWFVGPNNGLLYLAAEQDGILGAWKINEKHVGEFISNTFHGRDVFIKVGVYLSQGKSPEDFKSTKIELSGLVHCSIAEGQVAHVDHYGNLKIYFQKKLPIGKKLVIKIKREEIEIPIVKTFSDVSTHQPLALLGSSGTLEIAINLGNFAKTYSVQVEDILDIIEIR